MEKCFVIQPFDNGEFDKRFDEVIDPAISELDLEAYRVDRDPKTKILYQDIQDGIKNSLLSLADISTDNPNVWFELGYALARGKEVVMICVETRDKFPFDIQHRHIIRYKTGSPSDFNELKNQIIERIKASIARIDRSRTIEDISIAKVTEEFSPHEITTLAIIIAESLDPEGPSGYQIANEMEKAGFNKVATILSLKSLKIKGFIREQDEVDFNGNNYIVYQLSEKGEAWALQNQNKLNLKTEQSREQPPIDNDIPF